MSDFQSASAALATLRAAGIDVSKHFSGRLTLLPETRVLPHHREIVRNHEPALVALLSLQAAVAGPVQRRVAR